MQRNGLARVIVASSVGTVIEFYDFFIFARLATTIAAHFYPADQPTFGFLSTLATYALGLAVRPFGSLLFGRLGDTVGRKTTFLITLLMMGTSTAASVRSTVSRSEPCSAHTLARRLPRLAPAMSNALSSRHVRNMPTTKSAVLIRSSSSLR